jgi:phospholipid-binding lipoprotein MlaA
VSINASCSRGRFGRVAAVFLCITMLLPGCAQRDAEPVVSAGLDQTDDPLESVNRQIFDFNQFLDRILLKPLAQGYVAVLPDEGRDALRHVLDNMKEPTTFFNNTLQGELERAGITVGRFAINTTIGLGGIIDVAKDVGLKPQPADFGQTLYTWGIPSGPYLILPILGPSNPRDAIGAGVDSYADPLRLLAKIRGFEELSIGRFAADGIDQRARVLDVLDDLQKNSLDFYAQLRSLSQQRRSAELRRGAAANPDSNFYTDPGASSTTSATLSPAPAAAPTAARTTTPPAAPPVATRPPLGLIVPAEGSPRSASTRP